MDADTIDSARFRPHSGPDALIRVPLLGLDCGVGSVRAVVKRLVGGLAVVLLGVGVSLGGATSAQAASPPAVMMPTQSYYPTYCWHWSGNLTYNFKQWWYRDSCWVGGSRVVDDNAVRLPQWMVYWATAGACNAGILDGVVGTGTSNAIKCYQGKRGVTQDGVIGTTGWTKFAADAVLDYCAGDPQECYYGVGRSNAAAISIKIGNATNVEENYLLCSTSLIISIHPYYDTGSTGKTASQCPGQI